MVTIGVIRNPLLSGSGGGNCEPIPYLQLRVIARGEQGGVPNVHDDEYFKLPNDVVEGYKDALFYWESARFIGGTQDDRNNYTPLVEIELDEEYIPTVVVPPSPTINFGSVSCRSLGNCNDNSTCAVKFPITTSNAPAGSYIEMIQTASTSASATLNNDSGVFSITYQETTAVGASVNFTLYLKNSLGETIATSLQTITHQSYWSMIANCTVDYNGASFNITGRAAQNANEEFVNVAVIGNPNEIISYACLLNKGTNGLSVFTIEQVEKNTTVNVNKLTDSTGTITLPSNGILNLIFRMVANVPTNENPNTTSCNFLFKNYAGTQVLLNDGSFTMTNQKAGVIAPVQTYTSFGTYRKDDPCGTDFEIFTNDATGRFYYQIAGTYYLADPYSWFQYDRPENGEYIWVLQVFVGDSTYSGGEQSGTCSGAILQTSYYKAGDYPEYSQNGEANWGEIVYLDINGISQIAALPPNSMVNNEVVEGPCVPVNHYGIISITNAVTCNF